MQGTHAHDDLHTHDDFTHTHTHTQTDTQTDRQTHTHDDADDDADDDDLHRDSSSVNAQIAVEVNDNGEVKQLLPEGCEEPPSHGRHLSAPTVADLEQIRRSRRSAGGVWCVDPRVCAGEKGSSVTVCVCTGLEKRTPHVVGIDCIVVRKAGLSNHRPPLVQCVGQGHGLAWRCVRKRANEWVSVGQGGHVQQSAVGRDDSTCIHMTAAECKRSCCMQATAPERAWGTGYADGESGMHGALQRE
jgi:hypothetical protein